MRIKKEVLEYLGETISVEPPEVGGILGGKDENTVSEVFIDNNKLTTCGCKYIPNTELLNSVIAKWREDDICFMGMFHTHFADVRTLSYADREYISKIMSAMPEAVDRLYFPIYTLPSRELVIYKATRENRCVSIKEEEIEIT